MTTTGQVPSGRFFSKQENITPFPRCAALAARSRQHGYSARTDDVADTTY